MITTATVTGVITTVLQEVMDTAGMSELRLAEETGIPRSTLRNHLKRGRGYSIEEVIAVAQTLGTTASALIAAAEARTARACYVSRLSQWSMAAMRVVVRYRTASLSYLVARPRLCLRRLKPRSKALRSL